MRLYGPLTSQIQIYRYLGSAQNGVNTRIAWFEDLNWTSLGEVLGYPGPPEIALPYRRGGSQVQKEVIKR